ncbi:hypothetical protein Vadar_029394 [Vaccinium darrowii]|uniref:Uncharacterized protein n=1 Tax=Vaccinium darrowii TaxID=229202 RepID=A0ACB7ZEY5_9ERIC|nr:hypothetical protein Vadar_029394 [Vaccinium darrowii]
MTQKRARYLAGPMSSILQTPPTTSQTQHPEHQPPSFRTNEQQLQDQPQKKKKCWAAGPMTSASQSPLTAGQSEHYAFEQPPCDITVNDQRPNMQSTTRQHAHQTPSCGTSEQQQDKPPQKKKRCPAGPMTTASQSLPMASEMQPQLQQNQRITTNNQTINFISSRQATQGIAPSSVPVGPMTIASQSPPTASEMQPQMQQNQQPTTNNTALNLSSSGQGTQGAAPSSVPSRQGRGPAHPYAGWGSGEKMPVELDEENKPIGEHAAQLESQLGIIARNGNFAPLTFTDWRAPELEPYKARIWEEVKANTEAPEIYKHNCLRSVGRKWNYWKDTVKRKYYNRYSTDEERLANCPDRVDPNQWKILVAFWGSEAAKECSTKNGGNRGNQMTHSTGRKAHCRVRNEPDRIEVYEETHKRKNGGYVDKASTEAMSRIKEKLSQLPESLQSDPNVREEIFTDVLGRDKHGRVRTYGLGPCPSQVFGRYARSHDQVGNKDTLCAEVRQELLAEFGCMLSRLEADYKKRITRVEHKCARMQSYMESLGYPMLQPSDTDESPLNSPIREANETRIFNVECAPDGSTSVEENGEWEDNFGA